MMRITLSVKKIRGAPEEEKLITIPEITSLESIPEHVLWEYIIIPEILIREQDYIKSLYYEAKLLSIDFEKPLYEEVKNMDYFVRGKNDDGFHRIEKVENVRIFTGIGTLIYRDGEDMWNVVDSVTSYCISKDNVRIKAFREAGKFLKGKGYRKVNNFIIEEAKKGISPKYKEVASELINV